MYLRDGVVGQVSVTIAGRSYLVACDDGQEEHVTKLGHYLDHHANDLKNTVGHISEALLLILVSLLITDELWDCRHMLTAIKQERDKAIQALTEVQRREQLQLESRTSLKGNSSPKEEAFP